jgi:hypothetical protein
MEPGPADRHHNSGCVVLGMVHARTSQTQELRVPIANLSAAEALVTLWVSEQCMVYLMGKKA